MKASDINKIEADASISGAIDLLHKNYAGVVDKKLFRKAANILLDLHKSQTNVTDELCTEDDT